MKLTLLPLQKDNVVRVRSEGAISRRGPDDPLPTLLGPHCYTHRVLLNLDRSPGIDTSGLCWLIDSHKRFAQAGGKMVLFAVPPVVLDVLDFVRLTPLLLIVADERAACELATGLSLPPIREEAPTGPGPSDGGAATPAAPFSHRRTT
jgi:hypothetical protein